MLEFPTLKFEAWACMLHFSQRCGGPLNRLNSALKVKKKFSKLLSKGRLLKLNKRHSTMLSKNVQISTEGNLVDDCTTNNG